MPSTRSWGVDLDRLTDIDGTMDEVHGLRDRYGADLVALIVGRSSNRVCGVAWVPDFGAAPDHDWSDGGFSVTAHNCETNTYHTFAHELGHNQGAAHDPDNSCMDGPPPCSLPPPPTFPYRYGRCNTAEGWNTIMSYQRSTQGDCQREIEYFSSPTLNYRGTPTGDAARRDNRRVLLETARRVANYRQSGNTGGGTHLLPYILAENTAGAHGFVRIVNRSAQAGTVTLTAIDDEGRNAGTETLSLAANGAIHFTSRDLERGNADKGLSGVGAPSAGHWRLVLTSSLDIQPPRLRAHDRRLLPHQNRRHRSGSGREREPVHRPLFQPGERPEKGQLPAPHQPGERQHPYHHQRARRPREKPWSGVLQPARGARTPRHGQRARNGRGS